MNDDFTTAMQRALQATRAGDPGAATAIIQSALSGGTATAAPAPAPAIDGDARVGWHKEGGRDYRLFTPEGDVRGVILMLHGCTQNPDDFARGTGMDAAAGQAGYAVAYPAQTTRHNANACWNWFLPVHQSATGGEARELTDLARTLADRFDCPGRVFVAGLSAGGAMAAVLAEASPGTFAAIGVHSGLTAGSASDVNGAFAAMRGGGAGRAPRLPAIVFHGTSDTTVSPRNATAFVPGDGIETADTGNGRSWTHLTTDTAELWMIRGAGHAWSGGQPGGSFADPKGPDASTEMVRFFSEVATQ